MTLKKRNMRKNLGRVIKFVFVIGLLSGTLAACKAGHEVCPAYTNANQPVSNNY